jgi:type I restriction enzyme S subunit
MKAAIVPSEWLRRDGHRFDAGPYTSGAVEARQRLASLRLRKDRLADLTTGFNGGIYNGPQFARHWVDDPTHGVPFLGSSSMLLADLSGLPLLRRRDAESSKLSYLRISPGTTLVSCSGTIGRMVYTRPDMDGMWTSQHIMKVVPDPERIPPGYLYAFLSSRYGVPLVTSSTYGAIIQHIEPHHLADIPIPRLDPAVEAEAYRLVEAAASARAKAAALLRKAEKLVRQLIGPPAASLATWSLVSARELQARLDAYYYGPACTTARQAFDSAAVDELRALWEVADVHIPGIFKRRYGDPSYGYPYLTGNEVFQLAPKSNRYLLRAVAEEFGLVVSEGTILIQEAGQLGGLIGRSVLVGKHMAGFAVSNNMIRVVPHHAADTGYLFAVLSTAEGIRLIGREASGSSIPHIDQRRVEALRVPWAEGSIRAKIGREVMRAQHLRDEAITYEDTARELVEATIEEAA